MRASRTRSSPTQVSPPLADETTHLAAADQPLDEEQTRLLDEASEPPTPDYPYGEKGQAHRRRSINP